MTVLCNAESQNSFMMQFDAHADRQKEGVGVREIGSEREGERSGLTSPFENCLELCSCQCADSLCAGLLDCSVSTCRLLHLTRNTTRDIGR